jgi:D-arabinose 1-dehydrogenase-like Zn-dependent alcohol dehydrogenase
LRGLRITRWGGPLEPFETPDPEPGPGELRVKVEACGIGLTVVNYSGGQYADAPLERPVVPGHELVGVVDGVGPGTEESWLGERVTAHFYLFCGRCTPCRSGFEPLCERPAGQIGTARDGGYAELCTIPARNAVHLPAGLDPVEATVVADAVATPVHIARRSHISPGDRVAVIGAGGGVGIHMVQVARLHGARVVGLDVVEAKLAFLEDELGFAAVDSSDFGSMSLPPPFAGGLDVVVDFIGTEASGAWALGALAPNARLVVVNTFRDRKLVIDPRVLVEAQAGVMGSRYASRAELAIAADHVAAGRIRPVVSREVGLDGVEAVHDALRAGRLLGRGALVLR